MNIPISPRLLACCDFVPRGSRVADVCCDHGYLGIYLLKNGIASSVIASDINRQPLQNALRNAEKFGVSEKMQFFLSDGCRQIPRDFDVLVCAGIGADVMISILDAAPWLKAGDYRLILQCQSKAPLLRQYLSRQGWHITDEVARRDGRFLYTVIAARWEPDKAALTPGQYYFPPAMLKNATADTLAYCRRIYGILRKIAANRGENADESLKTALAEIESNPRLEFLKEEGT